MISFSPKLHVIKAISWRITGSVDTMIWAWVLSGDWSFGVAIGGTEMLTKIVLYYLHDRVWHPIESSGRYNSYKTHFIKTITWRCLGTLDTILLSWLISGSWKLGLQLGGIEIITKMVLYYMHERIWFRIKWRTAEHSVEI
jgi:uncharacterized membrane protein